MTRKANKALQDLRWLATMVSSAKAVDALTRADWVFLAYLINPNEFDEWRELRGMRQCR